MREGFVEPDDAELDRFSSLLAKMLVTDPPRDISAARLASLLAIGIAVYGRSLINVDLQWSLEPDAFVEDTIQLFQRHVELLHWTIEIAARKPDGEGEKLREFVPQWEVDKYDAALNELDRVRAHLKRRMPDFLAFARTQGKL